MRTRAFDFNVAAGKQENTKPSLDLKCAHDVRWLNKYEKFGEKGLISTELHN